LLVLAAALVIAAGCDSERPPIGSPSPPTVTMVFDVRIADEATIGQAEAVLEARLAALGVTVLASTTDGPLRLTLALPLAVERRAVEAVLRMPGLLEFVPWPAGTNPPAAGERVPDGQVPLFDTRTGIRSATSTRDDSGNPAVDMTLRADAADALADYSTAHVGEVLLMVLDGSVLAAPTIAAPIDSGELRVTLAPDAAIGADALAAIIASGPLPEGWGQP
jgi:preprotein translocase subunit SecD